MGRPEKPIAPCDKDLEALARWLRERRIEAGLSYVQLAERIHHLTAADGTFARCSADTLARAASGAAVPRLKTVTAYADACGADQTEAERLWKRARYRQSLAKRRDTVPPQHINYVRNFAELRAALVDLYEKDGSRPYEELERASDGVLAHSTVARVIGGVTGRPTRLFVLAFAQACGIKGLALNGWGQAWDRAEEQRLGGPKAVIQRRRPAFEVIRHPGGEVEVYVDRSRNSDGQETWRLSTVQQQMERYVSGQQQLWEQHLSAREVTAAQSIRHLRHPRRATA
ncbi:helix-turn-helix transcriptional regulator [Streptomyces sp. AgN23]|uniref:helix-turn-helix domain-containing protein n=1 Tax=Streptomyces sp. AgN23 TaxID=1188315 RepID=UPI001FF0FDB0|nr:helix-turn-helix transcriptional regulator [Streptomyces sp. AgN23]WTB02798.1 helix-turn-helix domain-containing protein [Streptomyces antimycoticus]WTB11322.1 helix-turn-helix domain-containing protein [Streptomyces antimycoticus]